MSDQIHKSDSWWRKDFYHGGARDPIVHIYGKSHTSDEILVIAKTGDDYGDLIAAAPDLLAACQAQIAADQHKYDCPVCAGPTICDEFWKGQQHASILRHAAVKKANEGQAS